MQRWTRIGNFALTDDPFDEEALRGPAAQAMLGLVREDSVEAQDLRRFLWELGHFDIERMNQHQVLSTLEQCLRTGVVGVLPWARMQEILFTPRSSEVRAQGENDASGGAKPSAPARESKPSPPPPKPSPQVVIPANWADEPAERKQPEPRLPSPPPAAVLPSTTTALGKLLTAKWGADKVRAALEAKRADDKLDKLLTDDEYLAVRAYTSSLYGEINPALRSGVPGEWQNLAEQASAGMTKMAQNGYGYSGDVTRRARFEEAEVLSLFQAGTVFVEKGFLSTSSSGPVFPGNTEFNIASKSGVRVDSLSEYPKESEVLFKPGSRFQVLSMAYDPVTDLCTINMKEVP